MSRVKIIIPVNAKTSASCIKLYRNLPATKHLKPIVESNHFQLQRGEIMRILNWLKKLFSPDSESKSEGYSEGYIYPKLVSRDRFPEHRGHKSLGKLFFELMPDDHPDDICKQGKYAPDKPDGMCTGCGWLPPTNKRGRFGSEFLQLYQQLSQSVEFEDEVPELYAAYRAYIDTFQESLSSTPDLNVVNSWWDGLPKAEKDRFKKEYIKSNRT
jgi:hypothetical protein